MIVLSWLEFWAMITALSAVLTTIMGWRGRINARRHRDNVSTLERMEKNFNARLEHIEEMLGNGTPGVFLRSERAEILVQRADERFQMVLGRLDRLEAKLS